MSEMSYEQQLYLHKFLHPNKMYPMLDEATVAGTLGTPVEIYRRIKADLSAGTRHAAEELLAEPGFAARVDRLPFVAGSTIAGLGDSITDDLQSWFEILRSLLEIRRPQDNIRFVNVAVSGDTTHHTMWHLLSVSAENPDWIICMIGTNDTTRHGKNPLGTIISTQETERNLAQMRNYFAHTSAKWVWITPYFVLPEKMASHWFIPTLQLTIANEDLRGVADVVRRQKDPVVDLQKALGSAQNPDYILDDGLHLSLAGQKATVRALVERLT